MKRASLILLVLASMIALACSVDSTGSKNAGNDNRNINYNSNTGGGTPGLRTEAAAADSGVITIAVVVCYDASRAVQVRVTDPIYVSATNHQKVRWCIYNNLDVALSSVSISAFNSGGSSSASPCSNTPNLTTGAIAPGNLDAVCTEFCEAAPSPAGTSFQYMVSTKPEGQNEVTAHGPRVIIQ